MPSMLVLGDSILWGQGLLEDQKCTMKLKAAWEASAPGLVVEHHRFAHSGADVWDDNRSGILAKLAVWPPRFPPLPHLDYSKVQPCEPTETLRDGVGEIPNDQPYILRQIFDAATTLQGKQIDLVVVDMGINDMTVYDLVLPGKSERAVVKRARSLKPYVKKVLEEIGDSFPNAKVLVTGYYAIVSKESNLSAILQFANDLVQLVPFIHFPWSVIYATSRVTEPAFKLIGQGLASRDAAWRDAMHDVLRTAVSVFNAKRGVGVAEFVDPDFLPQHSVFTSKSLLWQYRKGKAPDPRAQDRIDWCNKNKIEGFDRLIIESASLGHPSPKGAERYAGKLIEAAGRLGIFTPVAEAAE
jgi:hypothetical protein